MDQQTFSALCEYFTMVHSVTLRAIGAFTDRDLDFRPKSEMRTPRELIFHVYSQEKILAEAVQKGRFTAEAASRSSPEEQAVAAELQVLVPVEDLGTYAHTSHPPPLSILSIFSLNLLNYHIETPIVPTACYMCWVRSYLQKRFSQRNANVLHLAEKYTVPRSTSDVRLPERGSHQRAITSQSLR